MDGILQKNQNIFLILIVITGIMAVALGCSETSKSCRLNEDCCNGCCFNGKCVADTESCIKENIPCSGHVCPPNSECHLQKVVCIRAPCNPIPVCKPTD